jgi:CHAT domain-containing protein
LATPLRRRSTTRDAPRQVRTALIVHSVFITRPRTARGAVCRQRDCYEVLPEKGAPRTVQLLVKVLLPLIAAPRLQREHAAAPHRWAVLCAWICCTILASSAFAADWPPQLEEGVRARTDGNIYESISMLEQAVNAAPDQATRVHAMTQLGLSLAQAGRLADADKTLQSAYDESMNPARISIALALGNVALAEHDVPRASAYYREVLAATGESAFERNAKVAAELNLARLQSGGQQLDTLEQLYPRIAAIDNVAHRARAFFSLGEQASVAVEAARSASLTSRAASGTDSGTALRLTPRAPQLDRALRLSYLSLHNAADLAQQAGDAALRVEASDALAQLYETQGRYAEAQQINQEASQLAAGLALGQVEALQVRLDWRSGRLHQRLGDDPLALAAYMRAARHLEAIRQDLPIDDEAGKSTYQTLLKPIFVNLLDLMLKDLDGLAPSDQSARMTSVLDALELTHQAEMQDYLGDRCAVESIRGGSSAPLEAGVAVIYTLVLKDRLEVIVRTRDGLMHHAAPVSAAALDAEITTFRKQLLATDSSAFLATAQKLYGWLIEPFADRMAKSGVRELVIVPDGFLRLLPFAALHDGREFVAQRYVVSTVTGLTMTAISARRNAQTMSLLAGLSEPGPVVDQLLSMGFTGEPAAQSSARAVVVPAQVAEPRPPTELTADESALRHELVLPAVETEIQALKPYGRSVSLLNADFTVARFEREVRTGRYSVIHIATHGFFGDSAQQSFLLAFDNIIRIDDLQTLISGNDTQSGAIELLTLSACDTATGDDRAPLGFAGAAIKARARSVVGTLWAVSDEAAEQFMAAFYSGLAQQGKAEAVTRAQRALIQSPQFSHPYYWAPIVLIGDWN